MDKQIESVLQKVVNIPNDFYRIQTVSENTLLTQSGYLDMHDCINEEEISELLKINPSLINDWLQLSADQRVTEAWYFTRGEDGKCFVGHFPDGNEFVEISTTDEFKACAAFIKLHIEDTRRYLKSK